MQEAIVEPNGLENLELLADKTTLQVVLTGGGTGGHVYPALALAEGLLEQGLPKENLLYIGDNKRLEATKAPEAGLQFVGLTCSGLPRAKQLWRLPFWLVELWNATAVAKKAMQAFKPKVVVATGGYVAAPVLLAALSLKIPYLIHEPDARPGLVNKLFARWAFWVTAGFSEAKTTLGTAYFTPTGNPLRGALGHLSKTEGLHQLGLQWPEDKTVLLVLGGSLGARTLNKALVEALPVLVNELGLCVLHQTGATLFDETLALLKQQPEAGLAEHPNYCVRPFFDAMPAVWAASNVVVCRAGSLTLSEVAIAGRPAILVPYPHAAANHQFHNAQTFQQAGAALLLEDRDCNKQTLLALLRPLLKNGVLQRRMQEAALGLATPNARQVILEKVLQAATSA